LAIAFEDKTARPRRPMHVARVFAEFPARRHSPVLPFAGWRMLAEPSGDDPRRAADLAADLVSAAAA
jgi:hypothetical protein